MTVPKLTTAQKTTIAKMVASWDAKCMEALYQAHTAGTLGITLEQALKVFGNAATHRGGWFHPDMMHVARCVTMSTMDGALVEQIVEHGIIAALEAS